MSVKKHKYKKNGWVTVDQNLSSPYTISLFSSLPLGESSFPYKVTYTIFAQDSSQYLVFCKLSPPKKQYVYST